jgi:hypothetical protein
MKVIIFTENNLIINLINVVISNYKLLIILFDFKKWRKMEKWYEYRFDISNLTIWLHNFS